MNKWWNCSGMATDDIKFKIYHPGWVFHRAGTTFFDKPGRKLSIFWKTWKLISFSCLVRYILQEGDYTEDQQYQLISHRMHNSSNNFFPYKMQVFHERKKYIIASFPGEASECSYCAIPQAFLFKNKEMKAKVVLDIETSRKHCGFSKWVSSNKETMGIKISGKAGKTLRKDTFEVEH